MANPRDVQGRRRAPKAARQDKLARLLRQREREIILEHLVTHCGNVSATAADLGLSRRVLDYKLDEHSLRDEAARLRTEARIPGRRGS